MHFRAAAVLVLVSAFTAVSALKKGKGTYFAPGTGSCGHTNTAADHIVAVSSQLFTTYPGAGPNPNNNPICNKQIKIQYNGKSAPATIVDQCPGCKGKWDLDMSPAVFDQLGDEAQGVLQGITWDYV